MSKVAAGNQKSDPLRDQLDELDLLMERMLALGVSKPGKEPAQKPETRLEPPLPEPSDALPEPEPKREGEVALLVSEAPVLERSAILEPSPMSATNLIIPEEIAREERTEPQPIAAALDLESIVEQVVDVAIPVPSFVAIELSPAASAAPLYADFQFAPPPSALALEAIDAPAPPAPIVTESVEPLVFVAWWLQPLALVNGIYDGSTRWLGPIGRGLRSRPIKNLLGLCGLLALVGAVAWMAWENADWNS